MPSILELILAIFSLFISVLATWYFAKLYFKKAEKKTKLDISCEEATELIEITDNNLIQKLSLIHI